MSNLNLKINICSAYFYFINYIQISGLLMEILKLAVAQNCTDYRNSVNVLRTTGCQCHMTEYNQIICLYYDAENWRILICKQTLSKCKKKPEIAKRFNSKEAVVKSHEGVNTRERSSIVYESSDGEQDHSVLRWWCIGQTSYWLALPFCLDTSCHLYLESGIQDAGTSTESLQNKSSFHWL